MKKSEPLTDRLARLPTPAAALLLLAVIIPALYFQWNPAFLNIGDNAHYLNVASAIYNGEGNVLPHSPGSPPNTHTPPGYPAILAALMWLSGGVSAIILFKLFSEIFALGFFIVAFIAMERHFDIGRGASFFILIFLALSPAISPVISGIMTEAPFLFFAALVLLSALESESGKMGWTIGAAIFAAAAIYIRLAALPLAAAVFVWYMINRRFRRGIIFGAIFLALMAPWTIWTISAGGPMYISQASGLSGGILARIISNAGEYLRIAFPAVFAPWGMGSISGIFASVVLLMLALVGTVSNFKKIEVRLTSLWALATIPVYLGFSHVSFRYAAAIGFPLLFLAVIGARNLISRAEASPKLAKTVKHLLPIAILLSLIPSFVANAGHTAEYRRELAGDFAIDRIIPMTETDGEFYEALHWVRENTPEDAVIISSELRTAYFISRRRGMFIGRSEGDEIWERALKAGVDYLVVGNCSREIRGKLMSAMEPYRACFNPAASFGSPPTYVVKIDHQCLRESLEPSDN